MTQPTFHVKNFSRLQHYRDRSPPWIKLYNRLLDDYEFAALPDASKAHLLAIGLLASRYQNRIPLDAQWIGSRINATSPVDLPLLIKSGFVIPDQDCSKLLADCTQVAMPETETETETETERQVIVDTSLLRKDEGIPLISGKNQVDVSQAFADYNEAAQRNGWTRAQRITPARRKTMGARLREFGGVEGWRGILKRAEASDFLAGRSQRSNGHAGWTPGVDFFLQPKSLTGIVEGKYDNRLLIETKPPPMRDAASEALWSEAEKRNQEFMRHRSEK